MAVKERIYQYLEYKGVTPTAAERMLGWGVGALTKAKSITVDRSEEFLLFFSELSAEWLLRGKGQMCCDESALEQPLMNYEKGQPYFNVDFICGFDDVENDQTTTPECLVHFPPYSKADCWCNATGMSMYPDICPGDIIALKEVKDWNVYIPYGEIYGVVTTEHRTIKKICKSNKEGYIRLVPTNQSPDYEEQEIPISIITKLYRVLGAMRRF